MEHRLPRGGDELAAMSSSMGYTIATATATATATREFSTEPFSSSSPSSSPPVSRPNLISTGDSGGARLSNGPVAAGPTDPVRIMPDPVLPSVTRPTGATSGVTAAAAVGVGGGGGGGGSSNHARTAAAGTSRSPTAAVRYWECLKNHAASVGGHVVDGCGEFMPGGSGEGSDVPGDALKCAVCGCHRSFHRKEVEGEPSPSHHRPTTMSPYYYHTQHLATNGADGARRNGGSHLSTRIPPPPPLLALPPLHSRSHPPLNPAPMMSFGGRESSGGGGGTTTESSSEELDAHTPVAAGAPMSFPRTAEQAQVFPLAPQRPSVLSRKRFRTKFTAEQKEKMLGFAETVGWRMQRKDEVMVEQFCAEVGVSRQVFKVWMHNNKHISSSTKKQHGQQQQQQQQPRPPQQQQQQPTPP